MMPGVTAVCHCGAKYKVAASAAGKKARCKKCGEVFVVHPLGIAPQSIQLCAPTPAQGEAAPPAAIPAAPPVAETLTYAPTGDGGVSIRQGERLAFVTALLRTFLFPARPHNLVTLLLAWVVLTVGSIGGGFLMAWGGLRITALGFLVLIVSEGVFAAFCFNTISQAADGEDDLPALPIALGVEDWWRMLIQPLLAFFGTVLLSLVPAVVYFIALAFVEPADTTEGLMQLLVLLGVTALGMFFWPMLVLTVAMGSAADLLRVRQMTWTMYATFFPYCCTVALVYASAALMVFTSVFLGGTAVSALVVSILAIGIRAYAQTAAMRGIGVYYNRLSANFDWLTE
jgi:hypothetical protein